MLPCRLLKNTSFLRIASKPYIAFLGLSLNIRHKTSIKSPLYAKLLTKGCVFDDKKRPLCFPKNEEYSAALEKCIVVDKTGISVFYLCGQNAKKLLSWLVCSNIDGDVGSTIYTLMLNSNGRIKFDLHLTILDRDFLNVRGQAQYPNYILTSDDNAIETYIKSRMTQNVDFVNISDQVSVLRLHGRKIYDNPKSRIITINNCNCRFIPQTSELYVENQHLEKVYDQLIVDGAIDAGFEVLDVLDLEKGRLWWGVDMRPGDTPMELGLGHLCDAVEDYCGKAALKWDDEKKLMRLALDSKIPLKGQEIIYCDGQELGVLRRACYSPRFNKWIAHGMLQQPCPKSGKMQIEVQNVKLDALVL